MNQNSLKEQFSLEGKVALITGATGFLGHYFAEALAEYGADIVLADLEKEKCTQLANAINKKFSVDSLGIDADITNKECIKNVLDAILDRFNKIDIIVNNAAIDHKVDAEESNNYYLEGYPVELWNKIVNVNLTGTFLCSQIIGTQMAARGGGSIINISSIYGIQAPDNRIYVAEGTKSFIKSPAYGASKAGVLNLTKYLAAYWAVNRVRVNAVSFGCVENNQNERFISNYSNRVPMGRICRKNEVKGAVLFLASEASSYVTGQNIVVDGGLSIW